MLLGSNNDLENALLVALSSRTVATVPQMAAELSKKNLKPTIQGIYRALRKLRLEGVVVKEHDGYSIRIPWILDMAGFF